MLFFGNFDKLNAPYYLVSDFWIPVQLRLDAAQQPKWCFTFQLFANQNQPSTPNHEKCRCHKNPKWVVPCKINFFVTILSFAKCVMCTVLPRISDIFVQFPMSHDILGAFFGSKLVQFVKDWTFWRVPKTGCFFIIVLCTKKLCVLWRTERFGWQKICHFCTILIQISILY